MFSQIITHGKVYSRTDQVIFFEDCLPEILLGPFLNILSQTLKINWSTSCNQKVLLLQQRHI